MLIPAAALQGCSLSDFLRKRAFEENQQNFRDLLNHEEFDKCAVREEVASECDEFYVLSSRQHRLHSLKKKGLQIIRDPRSEVWSWTIQFWSVVDSFDLCLLVTCIQLGKCGNFCDYSYNYLYYYQARFLHKIHFQSVWPEQILNFQKQTRLGFAQKSVHREVRTVGQVVQLSDFTSYKKRSLFTMAAYWPSFWTAYRNTVLYYVSII